MLPHELLLQVRDVVVQVVPCRGLGALFSSAEVADDVVLLEARQLSNHRGLLQVVLLLRGCFARG